MLTTLSAASAQASTLLRILHLFYTVAHALPAESPFGLFDISQTDPTSMNLDSTNLVLWDEVGGDLQSQPNEFAAISAAGAGNAPFSTAIEPAADSTDLFDSSLSLFPNDPFHQVVAADSGCQANAIDDSNEIAMAQDQDLFGMSSGERQIDARSQSDFKKSFSNPRKNPHPHPRRSDLTFGDILSDEEHDCPGQKVAACCPSYWPETVLPNPQQTRVRSGCLFWTQRVVMVALSCLNKYRYCCIEIDGDGDGTDCDPLYPESQLEEKQGPSGFCNAPA